MSNAVAVQEVPANARMMLMLTGKWVWTWMMQLVTSPVEVSGFPLRISRALALSGIGVDVLLATCQNEDSGVVQPWRRGCPP
jgi:hypothetical protein